ncbi:OPT super [Mortierella alpina]|nr:OPT super [Mortierella alpina]
MVLIINSQRNALNGASRDPNNLWSGQQIETLRGSGLIYGALGPARLFAWDGKYGFVFFGFLLGVIVPVIQWVLSKRYPRVRWSKFNVSILAGGMTAFPNGISVGTTGMITVCLVFQYYIFRYHKNWWKKYTFILSSALDTGAAFTGLVIFLFLGGGISSKLVVTVPSWWGDHVAEDGTNDPYLAVDRCGAANNKWTGGT